MAEFVYVKALSGRAPMDMARRAPYPTDCWRRVERDGRVDRLATKYRDIEMRTEAPPEAELEGYVPPPPVTAAAPIAAVPVADAAVASEEADQSTSRRK